MHDEQEISGANTFLQGKVTTTSGGDALGRLTQNKMNHPGGLFNLGKC